jgi:hypothetical protein
MNRSEKWGPPPFLDLIISGATPVINAKADAPHPIWARRRPQNRWGAKTDTAYGQKSTRRPCGLARVKASPGAARESQRGRFFRTLLRRTFGGLGLGLCPDLFALFWHKQCGVFRCGAGRSAAIAHIGFRADSYETSPGFHLTMVTPPTGRSTAVEFPQHCDGFPNLLVPVRETGFLK